MTAPTPTPDTCHRVAGQPLHGDRTARPDYSESCYRLHDEGLGQLTRAGICGACGAAIYRDFSGRFWHVTHHGKVLLYP